MGIHGLLPQLKSIMTPIHIKELRGQCVAVDTYSWLHKGALSCSRELCKGIHTSRHIDYCMHRVNLLRHYGVKPLLIFDGALLPMKADQEAKRLRIRKENLERAIQHEQAGNSVAAYECYQKAVDISPLIAFQLIQILKKENVDYIVAPYEADAQMTFLSINNYVDAVITEDSDLIPFGCSRIIYKMDKFGQGVEFRSEMLVKNKDLSFLGFTKMMFLEMCIFSGCDYLQSLPGMGLKKAYTLIQNFRNSEKAIKHLRFSTISVPPQYEDAFKKAIWTFQYQRVYDPSIEDIVHLSNIPDDFGTDCDFLGPWLPQNIAEGIAKGDIDPLTKMPFQVEYTCDASVNKAIRIKESGQVRQMKKQHLLVQNNTLSNYFCLASIEAKRKFKAPQVKYAGLINEGSPRSGEDISQKCQLDSVVTRVGFEGGANETNISIDNIPSSNCVPDRSEDKENQPIDHEKLVNHRMHSMVFQLKNELHKPFLASHKELDSDSLVIVRQKDETIDTQFILEESNNNQSPSVNGSTSQETILKSGDHLTHFFCENISAEDIHVGKSNCENTTKKRKINHQTSEVVPRTKSITSTEPYSPGEGTKLICDISHLDRYSGIAEESMKKFVSVISAFRYNPKNGSRASGLRAPLRAAENTCNRLSASLDEKRKTSPPPDFSKFSYRPKLSKRTSSSWRPS